MKIQAVDIPIRSVLQVMLVCLLLWVPAAYCGVSITATQPPLTDTSLTVGSLKALLIADQDQSKASQKERKDPPVKAPEDNGPESQSRSESVSQKPNKALKPFRPSERIKADQAVDFPSDI